MDIPTHLVVNRFSLKRLSIQLMSFCFLLIVLTIVILTAYAAEKESERISEIMKLQAEVLVKNLAATSGDYLLTHDYTSIELSLLRLVQFPGIRSIQMSNAQGKLVADVMREDGKKSEVRYDQLSLVPPNEKNSKIVFKEKSMIVWQPIELGELLGWVRIGYSLDAINKVKVQKWLESIFFGIAILIVTTILLFLFIRRSTNTIAIYTDFAAKLIKNNGQQIELNKSSIEFDNLGTVLNLVASQLHEQSEKNRNTVNDLKKLAAFPEACPIMTLSIDNEKQVHYINPFGRELLIELSIEQNNIADLFPKNIDDIISHCFEDNKKQTGHEVTYKGRLFYWNFSPVKGKNIAHAYALEITPRIKP